MTKKVKHPEHVNLERYLISYADFITLLFATFVVLYALSQVDIKDFKSLQDSIQQAFSAPSVMQGTDGVMQDSSNSIFDTSQADSMIAPLMLEYVSQKYEEESMDDIQDSINQSVKKGNLSGVEATKTDRGLLIRFNDDCLFASGSATLTQSAKLKLDKVGSDIGHKFFLHNMRIEGHTDNQLIKSTVFPSNWELSSARASAIIRYLVSRLSFMPALFTAVGFADTRPIGDNSTPAGRAKNRRVDILILKNKFNSSETPLNGIVKMSKADQDKMQAQRIDALDRIKELSKAAENLAGGNPKVEKNTIILNKVYNQEATRIDKETKVFDINTRNKITGQGNGDWLKPPSISEIKVFSH
jgi:chemotaxis protein MotB